MSRKLTKCAQELQGTLKVWDKKFVENNILELSYTTLTHHSIKRMQKVVRTLEGIKKYLVFSFDTTEVLKADTVDCQTMCGGTKETLLFHQVRERDVEVVADENGEGVTDPNF